MSAALPRLCQHLHHRKCAMQRWMRDAALTMRPSPEGCDSQINGRVRRDRSLSQSKFVSERSALASFIKAGQALCHFYPSASESSLVIPSINVCEAAGRRKMLT